MAPKPSLTDPLQIGIIIGACVGAFAVVLAGLKRSAEATRNHTPIEQRHTGGIIVQLHDPAQIERAVQQGRAAAARAKQALERPEI
ncbi:MAG: hypothetical protein Fur005_25500 [Roseiflexaceae bacterium]